jgi:hypothetical protein
LKLIILITGAGAGLVAIGSICFPLKRESRSWVILPVKCSGKCLDM